MRHPSDPGSLSALVEACGAPLWAAAAPDERVWFNSAWASLTGRAPERDAGRGWLELVHPEDRARVERALATARETSRPFATRYRLAAKHGEWRDLEDRGRPLEERDGDTAWIGACSDRTQETRERERRRRLERALAALVGAPAGERVDRVLEALGGPDPLAGGELRFALLRADGALCAPGLPDLTAAELAGAAASETDGAGTERAVVALPLEAHGAVLHAVARGGPAPSLEELEPCATLAALALRLEEA